MLERLERVETKVDNLTSIVTVLDGRVSRLDDKVSRLDDRVASLEIKVTGLDDKVSALDTKVSALDIKFVALDQRMTASEQRLIARIDIQVEGFRELVQRTADGFGATLDSIVRELKEFRSEMRVKIGDTDLILRHHEQRITTLERSRPQPKRGG